MARIPADELERIKREVSLLDRVRAAGIPLPHDLFESVVEVG